VRGRLRSNAGDAGLRGIRYRPGAAAILCRARLVCGIGGIERISMLLAAIRIALTMTSVRGLELHELVEQGASR
jgi:hypothetical protein